MIRDIFGPAGKVAGFLFFVLISVVETEVIAWLPILRIVDLPLTEDLGGFFISALLQVGLPQKLRIYAREHHARSLPDKLGRGSIGGWSSLPEFCAIALIEPYPADKAMRRRKNVSANDPLLIPSPVVETYEAVERYTAQLDVIGGLNRNLYRLVQGYRLGPGAVISVVFGSVELRGMGCRVI